MRDPRFTPQQQLERKIKAWQRAKLLRSQANEIARVAFSNNLDRELPKIARAVTEEIRLLTRRIESYEREINKLEDEIAAKGGSRDH